MDGENGLGRAPHLQPLTESEPIPLIHREAGLIDRQVMKLMENRGVAYEVVFGAMDMGTLVAATEAGMGYLVSAERVLPGLSDALVIADDPLLPKLPGMRAGVFHKEGLDLKRNHATVEAFLSAVRPAEMKVHQVVRTPVSPKAGVWPPRTAANIHRS